MKVGGRQVGMTLMNWATHVLQKQLQKKDKLKNISYF